MRFINPFFGIPLYFAAMQHACKATAAVITLLMFAIFSHPAHAAGSIAVSYAASQSPLVVGQAGQHYKLNIQVSGGPVAGGIALLGALPAGIVSNGAISTSGGSLAGCPAAGANSLAGCVLTNAPNGLVAISIPVAVGAAATTGSANLQVNPGSAAGCVAGGNLCRADAVSIGVLDAVSDAVTSAAGAVGSFSLGINDKAPSGAVFSLDSASSCTASSVSAAGLASYTAPALGQTCLVNYKLCVAAVCDTAVLTVTSQGSQGTGNPVGNVNTLTVASPVASQVPKINLSEPSPRTLLPGGAVITPALVANQLPTPSRFVKVPKSDGFYDVTECVKDTVTGLIWEGKTASGVRAGSNTYTHYEVTSQAQLYPTGNPTHVQINAASNSSGYKNMVNSTAVCGSGAWRLPTSAELSNLYAASGGLNSSVAASWLPNTGNIHWSTTAPPSGYAAYHAIVVYFSSGYVGNLVRANNQNVRLVR